jgi:hypothetical protein
VQVLAVQDVSLAWHVLRPVLLVRKRDLLASQLKSFCFVWISCGLDLFMLADGFVFRSWLAYSLGGWFFVLMIATDAGTS